MSRVAFVSYNRFDASRQNGWHGDNGHRAFILQNSRGQKWGARVDPDRPSDDDRDTAEPITRVVSEIDRLWNELRDEAATLDHVVIYLGARGSERAIELARMLPPSNIIFIGCHCDIEMKTQLIRDANLGDARKFVCECGGHESMLRLLQSFLTTGHVA